jgi:hypothetical protein
MFGILVSQHRVQPKAPAFVAAGAARRARRLIPMLARMLGVIAWLPLVVLALKKAV